MDPFVTTTTESALQVTGAVVKRQLGYLFNYKDRFEDVKKHVEKLKDAWKRVQNQVSNAEMNAEEIQDDVKHWLEEVDMKIKRYESFIHNEFHARTKCSIGFFSNNLKLRYQLGRNATKMVEEIKTNGYLSKEFNEVSYRVGPSVDIAWSNTGYESFVSRNKTLELIMKALEDSTVNMIGVYGIAGVGKTTLVMEVAKKAKENKLFKVVVANITRNVDIQKIQGQIAEMIGLTLKEENVIVRANRIRKRLQKEKGNTLVILDDLWDGFDLNKLGIPNSYDDRSQQDIKDFGHHKIQKQDFTIDFSKMKKDELCSNHNKCKILLTSRSKEVLCIQIDVQERSTFLVGVLEPKEAKTLLKNMAGVPQNCSEFNMKANEIAKMCAGLPIALVSIGKALKNKSSFEWEDIYQQIKRGSFTREHETIEFTIKLSYDHLKNEQLKHIFLQCARMGHDALIMDLVKFYIGLGLLHGVHTIGEARNKINVLVKELKELSLLMQSCSDDQFNMHDIMRDVALSISSKEKHVFFMKTGTLDEWPHKDELERYTAIFLHHCDIIDELPNNIYCPKLEVLHIDNKDDFLEIPDEFFKDMTELKVLILTGVNLSWLPSSIKCLKKLRMLCLEKCTLRKNLSIIGSLKKLRILTFSGSNIEILPDELGQLDKLQLFDLSNCSKLKEMPPNTISRMKNLEEFYIRKNLILWEDEKEIESEIVSLYELKHLNRLRTLKIHIRNVAHFPQNLYFDKLDSYRIVIEEFQMLSMKEFKIPDKHEVVKFLALNLKDGIDIHSENWIKMLFQRVEYLLLGELYDVRDVFYELNVEGFQNLKHLAVANNSGFQHIIMSIEFAFPELESMCLYNLLNLEKICGNQLIGSSFCKLKIIKIEKCAQLENLFPFSMVKLLTMVETLEVCDCDSLKTIAFVERETHTNIDDKVEFPQLQLLTLKYLQVFSSLYTNRNLPLNGQSKNEQSAMDACLSLFNEKVLIPKLERLELSSINISKIWSDQALHCFQKLLTLNVTDCCNLKHLMTLSMAGSLVNLQSLSLSSCEMMEDIFHPEDIKQNVGIFPNLKKMEIICMEKLNDIWQSNIGLHSFSSLDSLTVMECHKLITIFPTYMEKTIQNLQRLTITNCKSIENIFGFGNSAQTCDTSETNLHSLLLKELPSLVHIWKDDTGEKLKYNNLQSIIVDECPKLKYIFPLSIANGLENLEILWVNDCGKMKQIVAWVCGLGKNEITFKFPHLNTLSLHFLSELVSFYEGRHTLDFPSLKKLFISHWYKLEGFTTEIESSQEMPIVFAEKEICNLEEMAMGLSDAEWLKNKYIDSVHRMNKLQNLYLYELKNTEVLFWFLRRLPNIKSLSLRMGHMKRIWTPRRLISNEKIGVVTQLKELELIMLFNLEEIGFEHDPLLQRVERLVINECMKLKILASSSISLSYLKDLEVVNCRLMKNLMTCSTATSLVQLTTMMIKSCPMIVEIIENEEEKVQIIEFVQLKSLKLISLPSLTSFCSFEKCELKFPQLENLLVNECPQMTKFSQVQSAPKLLKVHVEAEEKDRWYWEGELNGTLHKISKHQLSLEYSEYVRLVDYPEMKEVRLNKPAFSDNFFGSLKKLEFDAASKRDIVIPSHVLPYLRSLEELHVHSCGAAVVIFEIDDGEATNAKKAIAFRLKKLTLQDSENLKCVWSRNPKGIVSFPNLKGVVVEYCGRLTTLFPLSLARNLVKLKTLRIHKCEKLVEIVGIEDAMEHGTAEMFEFPCLFALTLWNLPLLRCFYPGNLYLECPTLESLEVSFCPKLKLFASEFDHEAPISMQEQSLFSVEKIVPKLKMLTVNKEIIILLSDARFPKELLFNLNVLDLCLEDDDNKKDTLPFDFLHKVPGVEHLKVRGGIGVKEIFPSHGEILGKLNILTLDFLPKLESIGLEYLSAVSFINLKQLMVSNCQKMEYLFTFSTAKSLVQLMSLDIQNCKSIKEIVKKEDEDALDMIIFGRLQELRLDSIQRLVSFYTGNATLQFPCLRRARITECPNMKTFSDGIINKGIPSVHV